MANNHMMIMSKSSMLWIAVATFVVASAISEGHYEPTPSPPPPPPPPPSELVSGSGQVKGVGNLNGTLTDPPTLCGSLEPANATGCGYLTPNPHGNLTVGNTTVPVNIPVPTHQ